MLIEDAVIFTGCGGSGDEANDTSKQTETDNCATLLEVIHLIALFDTRPPRASPTQPPTNTPVVTPLVFIRTEYRSRVGTCLNVSNSSPANQCASSVSSLGSYPRSVTSIFSDDRYIMITSRSRVRSLTLVRTSTSFLAKTSRVYCPQPVRGKRSNIQRQLRYFQKHIVQYG